MHLNSKHLWYFVKSLGLAIAYVVLGFLGMQLTLGPHYASPLFPAAGLALAALLGMGLRFVPAIAVGAVVFNVLLTTLQYGRPGFVMPMLTGLGSTLAALAGAWAIRRWVSRPLLLSEPRDLALFFGLGAALSTLISATIGSLSLLLSGEMATGEFAGTWSAWWLGDTLGIVIGAPITLTLLGRPRGAWAPRRLSVGLPLLVVTLLMSLGILAMAEWDTQRAHSNFDRDALNATKAMEAVLREPLMALEANHSLLLVAPRPSREEFERGTAGYLQAGSPLLAMGQARRVARTQVPEFDRVAQAEGLAGYRARDRQRPGDVTPPAEEDMLPIRLIEPLARNAAALGTNILSIPVARAAAERARLTGLATATAGFQLSQDKESTTGVVIYRALYAGSPQSEEERRSAFQGVAFATLRPDLLLKSIAHGVPAYLALCLLDTDPLAQQALLAGPAACAKPPEGMLLKRHALEFAGRDWDILVFAAQGGPVEQTRSWPFAIVALASTGLLGALLLMVTGRARRIESLVLARTAELKREVAEREEGARALIESEQRFRNIFENAAIGVVFTDLSGRIREVNPFYCRMLGYPAARLLQMSAADFTHEDDRAEDRRLAERLLRGEITTYRRHKRYLTADGRELQVRVLVSMLRDREGKPHRQVGVVEDISDQLKMQELERTAQAADAANRAKNEFLSRMSHELRTPLNAMLGFTQLLEIDNKEPLSPRQRGRTGQIQQAGWHLLEMINDTLDLSRIESGALKLEPVQLSLAQLLDEVLSLIEADAAARQITLQRALDEKALFAWGDATRVKQVLTNLLSNAVKYNVDGGSITISTLRLGAGHVEICVSDTGLGLTPEQQTDLFQPFNRLGRESSGIAGTGIGLVISKRLAQLMGGDLAVSSTSGKGSNFALRLPAAEGLAPAAAEQAGKAPSGFSGPRRIVYIEDNATNAEVMRGILEQRPQIDLAVYSSGRAGAEAVLANPPDLLLLDMQLPDMDGLAVLATLRADGRAAKLTVVAVSANALPEQIRASREQGVEHYLTKPIDAKALLALLDEML